MSHKIIFAKNISNPIIFKYGGYYDINIFFKLSSLAAALLCEVTGFHIRRLEYNFLMYKELSVETSRGAEAQATINTMD